MALRLYETLKEAITVPFTATFLTVLALFWGIYHVATVYPATFFMLLALLWAIYHVVTTDLFESTGGHHQRSPTMKEELKQNDGSDDVSESSASSSSTSSLQQRHEVFLSFRGEDTRNNFLCYLDHALRAKGIQPYLDSKELPRGEEISPALLKAIEDSELSAIVFSENYATSSWCLEEVSHIMQCWRSRKGLVVPIFYHVDPSDVRKQTGSFGAAFIEHENNRRETDKVQKWRDALAEAGNLSGWHLAGDKPELEDIEKIVQDIINKLSSCISQSDYKGLVGIGPKLEQIKSLLRIGEEGVYMIGIWGMGGIGKTTLVKIIYDEVSGQFESSCLILEVRDRMKNFGAIALRNELLSALLKEVNDCPNMVTPPLGFTFVKGRLRHKRVLVVLDDVDDFEQFEKLEINRDHLGSGSRIIVTSRDKQVLENGKVDEAYKVGKLNDHDSLQLFSLHAFRQNQPIDDFRDLSAEFLKYAGGLPIALKTLGAALLGRNKEYWESALNKLKKHHNDPKIFNLLKISFDGLDVVEKDIFLDMTCFFDGFFCGDYVRILDGCYPGMARWALDNLVDKCLLTEGLFYDDLTMHDLLREMGLEIICQESIDNPGKRSRLYAPKDVCQVLKCNMGTGSIKGISLNMNYIKAPVQICPTAFENMINLVFLRLEGPAKLLLSNQSLTYLPDELRYFQWDHCPLKSLPSNFSPNNLIELRLSYSNIEELWNGDQDVGNLRIMHLTACKNLRKIPNLLGASKLEALRCEGCESLVELPSMSHLMSLKALQLEGCRRITKFPEIPANGALEELHLGSTPIEEVPSFIGSLKRLRSLDMRSTKIQNIPSSIAKLEALREIQLSFCHNLEELNLNMTSIEEAPSLKCLERLEVSNCGSLKSLLGLPPSLVNLDATDCVSLERVSFLDSSHYDHNFSKSYSAQYEFRNCFNLSQDARNHISATLLIRSQFIAKIYATLLAKHELSEFYLEDRMMCHVPCSEILDQFENQSRNSSISVNLGSAVNQRFLCFALCIDIDGESLPVHDTLEIQCEYQLKSIYGGQKFKRQWIYRSMGRFNESFFFLCDKKMVHKDMHYDEASFDFHTFATLSYYSYRKVEVEVEKCGVQVFYVDAESCTICDVDSSIDFSSSDEDSSLNIDSPNSGVRSSMIEDDANVENGHPATTISIPVSKRSVSVIDVGFSINFSSHEDIRSCSPNWLSLEGSTVEEDVNGENGHDDPVHTPQGRDFQCIDKWVSLKTPNSQVPLVRSSMIQDDANVENAHSATTTSRLVSKTSFSSDHEGDHGPKKRVKLFEFFRGDTSS